KRWRKLDPTASGTATATRFEPTPKRTSGLRGGREPSAESREPRAESREPRAESRKPRAESREPRAGNGSEGLADGKEPAAAARTHGAIERHAEVDPQQHHWRLHAQAGADAG